MTLTSATLARQRADRIRAVRATDTVNGIDFVEVSSADQRTLDLTFVHPLPGQAGALPAGMDPLGPAQIRLTGGVRVTGITATTVTANGRVLRVVVDRAGDFSPFELALVAAPGSDAPPPGIDPVLARITVNFKVSCPSDLDCLPGSATPPPAPTIPIDYLARDWPSFRRAMLDRMSATAPNWKERSPADLMVTLVEALAFEADRLAYMQDAVAAEAYPGTARRRTSLRRHARLLDYEVHEGCNARTWVALIVTPGSDADGAVLPEGSMVAALGRDADPVVTPDDAPERLGGAVVFETMAAIALSAPRSTLALYDWSGAVPVLPQGATAATFRRSAGLVLAPGDVLILEETADPETGIAAQRDLSRRAAVRLTEVLAGTDPLDATPILTVAWHRDDALPFSLTLTAEALVGGLPTVVATAQGLGNVVLADEGQSLPGTPGLSPAMPDGARPFRPRLDREDIVFAVPHDPALARAEPARSQLAQDPRQTLPAVLLTGPGEVWRPRRSLLGCDRFAREFVVEPEPGQAATLRFGDDIAGRAPSVGTSLTAALRRGGGVRGNLGADSLTSLVTPLAGITAVRNPLPASGGTAPESAEEIRRYAPEAFRTQARAVTPADWVQQAEAFPGVARARVDLRWTGSWYTVFVTIDREEGGPVRGDPGFATALLDHLDRFRVAGYDLDLRDPVYLPLDITLLVCLAPGYVASDLRGRLAEVFSSGYQPGGQRGLFHPDTLTFGDPLYLSRVYAAALGINGVASVRATVFHPRGRAAAGEIAAGVVRPGPTAILRCDSDPNRPENGFIAFDVRETT